MSDEKMQYIMTELRLQSKKRADLIVLGAEWEHGKLPGTYLLAVLCLDTTKANATKAAKHLSHEMGEALKDIDVKDLLLYARVPKG